MSNDQEQFTRNEKSVLIAREYVLDRLNISPDFYPQMLEQKFPHVLARIVALWNTPDGEDYLNDLLKPNCSGGRHEREGFPYKAWDEILHLLMLYRKPRPKGTSEEDIQLGLKQFALVGAMMGVFGKGASRRK